MRKRRTAALSDERTGTPAEAAKQPEGAPPPKPTSLAPAAETLAQHSIAEKLGLKMDAAGNLDIPSIAYVLYTSKMFPDITSVSQGIVKLMVGKEIGLAPMASVMGVHIIKQRSRDNEPEKTSIMVGAHLIAAKIKASGRYDYDVLQLDHTICEFQPYVKRDGQWKELKRISFTVEEAKQAGYGGWGKDGQYFKTNSNWAKDPQAMCFARAVTRMEKVHFADLTGMPTYTPDELGFRVDESGNALTVKGVLVPDDIPQEDLDRLQKSIDKQQPGGPAVPNVPRPTTSGMKLARLQQIGKDKGWPLVDILDLAFGMNAFVNKEKAELLWDTEAYQALLELLADDTYDALVIALDQDHDAWLKQTEGHVIDEAEQIISDAKGPDATKVTTDATIVTSPSEMSAEALEAGAQGERRQQQQPNGKGELALDRDQYDDLWSLVGTNPKLIQATKDYAREQLGYAGLKTLRDVKQKHLKAVTDFAQRWGEQ